MRIIAIIANLILLGVSILLTMGEVGNLQGEMLFYVVVFIFTPLVSLFVLFRISPARKGLFGLWLERKALEEQKKIERLSNISD